jgi:hypothetical protein
MYIRLQEYTWSSVNASEFCNRVENSKMYELYLPYSNPFYI